MNGCARRFTMSLTNSALCGRGEGGVPGRRKDAVLRKGKEDSEPRGLRKGGMRQEKHTAPGLWTRGSEVHEAQGHEERAQEWASGPTWPLPQG